MHLCLPFSTCFQMLLYTVSYVAHEVTSPTLGCWACQHTIVHWQHTSCSTVWHFPMQTVLEQ